MKITPLHDRVLLVAVTEERKKGGIILPETIEKERPQKGTVIAVGPGKFDEDGKRMTMSVKKGDTVLFSKYGPSEIKVPAGPSGGEDKEYLIAKEDDILAIID